MPTELVILYTANLHADFARMARFATQIQAIRGQYGPEPHPILLLDIGQAWSTDVWVSRVTEHRAPYLVLDAMAYHVAHADGLNVGAILGLQGVVQLQLMDHTIVRRWQWRDIVVNIGPRAVEPCVRWNWESSSSGEDWYQGGRGCLTLFPVDGIGHLEVSYPDMTVQQATLHAVLSGTRPDPTIVATTEYVEREARFYESKQKGNSAD